MTRKMTFKLQDGRTGQDGARLNIFFFIMISFKSLLSYMKPFLKNVPTIMSRRSTIFVNT